MTEKSEWYSLKEARCQLLPYTRPRPEFAVASTFTPSGGKLAGRYAAGMLCVAASQQAGYDVLGTNWQIACEIARENGREMDRSVLRLVAPMHIAESREEAVRERQVWPEQVARLLHRDQSDGEWRRSDRDRSGERDGEVGARSYRHA